MAAFPQSEHPQVAFDLAGDIFDLVQLGKEGQVALCAQLVVHARGFSQDADRFADLVILFSHLVTGYPRLSRSGCDER